MNHKLTSTLLLLLSLFSSSSSSSSFSSSPFLVDENEGESQKSDLSPSLLLSPPVLFLSRLSSGSRAQISSAGLEPSLANLNSLLSDVERKMARLKNEEEEEERRRENGLGGREDEEEEGRGGRVEEGELEEILNLFREKEEEEEGGEGERGEKEKEEEEKRLKAFINFVRENREKNSELKRNSQTPIAKHTSHSHSKMHDSEVQPHSQTPSSIQTSHSQDVNSKTQGLNTRRSTELRTDSRAANANGADHFAADIKLPKPPGWNDIIENIKEKLEELKEVLLEALQNLQEKIDGVFDHILQYYLPDNSSAVISQECAVDVNEDTRFAPVNKKWFLKMMDSWGKIPDGFFWGNVHVPGMYEECIKMHVTSAIGTVDGMNETRHFWGRYCKISYKPNSTKEEKFGEEEEEEEIGGGGGRGRVGGGGGSVLGGWGRAVLPSLRSGVSLARLANPLPFSYATCIPSSCTAEDLQASLAGVLAQDGLELDGVDCQLDAEAEEELGEEEEAIPEDKAFISIISIFGILAILATIYEVIVIVRSISSFEALLNFSLLRNMTRVFTYDNGKETGDVITCLPMMRVVTMLWIIVGHQYETNATFIANLFDSFSYQEPSFAQIVTDGWLSVDTFFFMAGLTVAFRLVPYLRHEDGWLSHAKTLATVMVRRVVRLAPVILVVALFCASLLRQLAHGPNAGVLESFSQDTCRKHWWKDPLFIDNILFPDNEGYEVNDCLSHCWFTAVDVQLLLLLPIIFPAAMYHELAGVVVLCVLTIASIAAPLALTLAYDLPPSPLHHVLGEVRLTYMTKIFMAPWCRMAPWLVGVWTAILLRTPRARRLKLNKLVVTIGYVVAIVMGLVLVVGLLPYNRLHFSLDYVARDWHDYPAVNALYGSLARPTWGLCLAWVVFTCHTGNADFINKILSYQGWLPISRLTFSMYIVAPVVQIWWAAGLLTPTYFNYLGKLFESAGVFAISLLLGLILTCLVELPLISTFNLLIPSPAKKHERAVRANINKNNNDNNMNGPNPGDKIFPL